jgi:hypothetical protein
LFRMTAPMVSSNSSLFTRNASKPEGMTAGRIASANRLSSPLRNDMMTNASCPSHKPALGARTCWRPFSIQRFVRIVATAADRGRSKYFAVQSVGRGAPTIDIARLMESAECLATRAAVSEDWSYDENYIGKISSCLAQYPQIGSCAHSTHLLHEFCKNFGPPAEINAGVRYHPPNCAGDRTRHFSLDFLGYSTRVLRINLVCETLHFWSQCPFD